RVYSTCPTRRSSDLHLHRYQFIKGHSNPVVYSSSPLAYSFSEAGQEKKVVIIDVVPKQKAVVQAISLHSGKPLKRMSFDNIDLAVDWLRSNPYTLVELTLISNTFMSSADLRSEEHTSELQSRENLVCRLLLEKK